MFASAKITGMTCEHCAASVSSALASLSVIHDISVDPETDRAEFESAQWILPNTIEAVIEESGYKLASLLYRGETTFFVKGMHCQNCVRRVTALLESLDAIESVSVDLEAEQVQVSGSFDPIELVRTLEAAGYEVGLAPKPDDLAFISKKQKSNKQISGKQATEKPAGRQPGDHKQTGRELTDGPAGESVARHPARIVNLAIKGMSCASCVGSVERALSGVAGTVKAAVNFADESASCETTASVETLIKAVDAAGYSAHEMTDESVEEKESALARDLSNTWLKTGVALVTGGTLMLSMMFGILPAENETGFWIPVGVLILGVMYFSGGNFYRGAFTAARHGEATMDTLISLGTGTAWIYSMLVLLAPGWFVAESRHLFFEAAVFILGFVGLGKGLESNAKGKTSVAIRKLLDLQPRTVIRLNGEGEVEVPLGDVHVGDKLKIRPGETIPVDGVVLEGESRIDESLMTGEPGAVGKVEGETVKAGTRNIDGSLVIEAELVGAKTVLGRIVATVRHAQNSKPAIGRLTDKIAGLFVPAVILVSCLTAMIWGLFGPEPVLNYILVTSMSVLIVACPCALGLAIPMSIMVGVGRGANEGLLFKNSDALQASSKLTMIVLDKTGTLTKGQPEVVRVEAQNASEMVSFALSLELLSEHPLARAICEYARRQGSIELPVKSFLMNPGGGVQAEIGGEQVAVGSLRFLAGLGMKGSSTQTDSTGTLIYVGKGESVLGYFELQDSLKPDSAEAVGKLKALGLKVVMLTGDMADSAKVLADKLHLDDYGAGLLPQEKFEKIQAYQACGEKVGMVGDGINDSLALSTADVGFAMSQGADIALESADVALTKNSINSVVQAIGLSRATMSNIYQNLFFAFIYNLVLIPVAAGLLYPLWGILMNPVFAAIAMAASSITVVFNANRIRYS